MTAEWTAVADWLAGQSDQTIETSCARVFLAGDSAWKIKRPVDLGYLDFSSVAKRERALRRELEFNRRWTADIYRRVRRVTRSSAGFAFDGTEEPVEWVLEMRRFDPDAVLAHRLDGFDDDQSEALGRQVAHDHARAAALPDDGSFGAYGYTVEANATALPAAFGKRHRPAITRLVEATTQGLELLRPLLRERAAEGFFRACHGDLHLGNILVENGRLIPFDCIEFSDVLARMDIFYDMAFPAMDLVVRSRPAAANRLLNGYLDEAARHFPGTLWRGLAALAQFLAVRASVRAHVNASNGDAAKALAYLSAAEGFLAPATPRLFAVGGLSGAGKSVLARAVAPLAGDSPGAIVLRSDEIRKRQAGVAPTERLPPTAYSPAVDAKVADEMLDLAADILKAGRSVVLDATFLSATTRARVGSLARDLAVPFSPVWLEGETPLLRRRLLTRRNDASDADAGVLERQLAVDASDVAWPRLPAERDPLVTARQLAAGCRG